MESRRLLAVLLVSNTNDAGTGSLREAISTANAASGLDTIQFDIPGVGPHTIQPLSALPTITDPLVIDGTSEPDFAGTPVIELDGSFAGSTNGLTITAGGSTVRSLAINRFSVDGIDISGGGGNLIVGNFIGTDVTGTIDLGNNGQGIDIISSADNRIGTDGDGSMDAEERNLISGNEAQGILIRNAGADNNVIAGNYIGVDVTGANPISNTSNGIYILNGATGTRVGTDGSDDAFNENERNVISGNDSNGIWIRGEGTDNTVVSGNYIGVDATGSFAVNNATTGGRIVSNWGVSVGVDSGPENTRLGTDGNGVADEVERNILSGNLYEVLVLGHETNNTVIAGNYIGTDETGNVAIPNGGGIQVRYGAQNTRIGTDGSDDAYNENERNLISGNHWVGILVQTPEWWGLMPPNGITTDGTVIAGNYIGVNADGTAPLGNGSAGIYLPNMATNVRVGTDGNGTADNVEGNVISSNGGNGIQVEGWTQLRLEAVDQFVSGEIPTTTATTTINQADLVEASTAQSAYAPFDNPIPGKEGDHYAFRAIGTINVPVSGNYSFALSGDDGGRLRIDGDDIVVDNAAHGLLSSYGTTYLSAGSHNFEWIGLEYTGYAGWEIAVKSGVDTVGPVTGAGWTVLQPTGSAVTLQGSINVTTYYPEPGDLNLTIAGNHIGVDASGQDPNGNREFANNGSGVFLQSQTQGVLIGTDGDGVADQAERNVISGNTWTGVNMRYSHEITVAGNYIGTDASGTVSIGNGRDGGSGVLVNESYDNVIGTNGDGQGDADEGNLVSGNQGYNAVWLLGVGSERNVVAGNLIGTDVNGTSPLGNRGDGIEIKDGASNNLIGTNADGVSDIHERNVISANTSRGVWMWIQNGGVPQNNMVAGNFIGTDITGTSDLGNASRGVMISNGAANNIVGTNGDGVRDVVERNIISGNDYRGVEINGPGSDNNKISGNYFGTDVSGTVQIQNLQQNVFVAGGAKNTIIGTDGNGIGDADEGNVIASSQFVGILITSTGTEGTVIAGNLIGLDATGTVAFGNGTGGNGGIRLRSDSAFTRVGTNSDGISDELERNVVSANNGPGIQMTDATHDNLIAGNYAGLDITGTTAVGNTRAGIAIESGSYNNVIGGTTDVARNVASGNIQNGIEIRHANTFNNWIVGNYVGTDVDGLVAIPNLQDGIAILSGAKNNIIGTNGDGVNDHLEGNLISGNWNDGISIDDAGAISAGLATVDELIAGTLPSYTVARSIGQSDLFDAESKPLGNFPFDHVVPGGGGYGYAFRAATTINVTTPGTFTFALSSDDGGRLRIDGSDVVVDDVFSSFSDTLGEVTLGIGNHSLEWVGFQGQIESGFELAVIPGSVAVGPSTDPTGWKVLGDPSPHSEIDIVGSIAVTAYYALGTGVPMLNTVAGNLIGTDKHGTGTIGNAGAGIKIFNGASANLIGTNGDGTSDPLERNVIAGNAGDGVVIRASNNNTLGGNYIGTTINGTAPLANAGNGVLVELDAAGNTIGGPIGNLISGNSLDGITLHLAHNNIVAGNLVGTDATGNAPLPNEQNGIFVTWGASNNTIGGNSSERNIISGHNGSGIAIDGAGPDNWIAGNYVGLGASGSLAVSNFKGITINNASGQIIGTNSDGIDDGLEGNVVTGNVSRGIEIAGNSEWNVIAGNLVGTGPDGLTRVGSQSYGVTLGGNSQNNLVGTDGNGNSDFFERNVIAGASGNEVTLVGAGVIGNRVAGNVIGIGGDGKTLVPNADRGVSIEGGASNNLIGTNSDGQGDSVEGNVIGGMTQMGILITASNDNRVSGNLIGTDESGLVAKPNAEGIRIENGASGNIIGTNGDTTNDPGERNVVSGNSGSGVVLSADANIVAGNLIGLAIHGSSPLPNLGNGVEITLGATNNVVGSNGDGVSDGRERNVISANAASGIAVLLSDGNLVAGNSIGTDVSGTLNLGNALDGIRLVDSSNTTIGGTVGNTIAFNQSNGVSVIQSPGELSLGNAIRKNHVYRNTGLGIDLNDDGVTPNDTGDGDTGANDQQNFPIVTSAIAAANTVVQGDLTGFAPGVYSLDFYASPTGGTQGKRFLGTVAHDTTIDGTAFTIDNTSATPLGSTFVGEVITATATDASDNTSEFSGAVETVLPVGVSPTIDEDSLVVSVIPDGDDDGAATGFLLNDFGVQTRIIPEGRRMRVDGLFADAEPDETHTVTIDFGDGTTDQQVFTPGDNGFSFEHVYVDDLSSQFDVDVTSSSLLNDGLLLTLPPGGGAAIVDGETFTISNATAIHTFEFDNDGLVLPGRVAIPFGLQSVDEIAASIISAVENAIPSSLPVYLDDGNLTLLARVITVTVSDGVGSGSTTIGITVQNSAPTFDTDGDGVDEPLMVEKTSVPGVLVTSINEGASVTLSGAFVDPGGQDQLTLNVNWGDGTPSTTVPLAAGSKAFALVHTYTDNVDHALINVTLRDDDGGVAEISTTLAVNNVAPVATITGPASGLEGTPLTLGASVSDPGNDSFSYVWKATVDGQQVASGNLAEFTFTPADEGNYVISLVLTDDDGGSIADTTVAPPIYTATRTITVANAAPTIDSVNPLQVVSGGATVTSVPEGTTVSLAGLFNDLGLLDSHQITIDWGDGTDPFTYVAGQYTAASNTLSGVSHRYRDDAPTGTPADVYTIRVAIADGDADSASGAFTPDGGVLQLSTDLTITNVDPTVRIMDNGTDDLTIRLNAAVEDPGGVFADFADTHTFSWTANYVNDAGDTIPIVITDQTLRSIEFERPAALLVNVSVTATDDDGGVGSNVSTFIGGTSGPDEITVIDSGSGTGELTVTVGDITATFTPGDQLIIASGGGNDVLNIDTGVNAAVNVDLGDGDDSVVSGSGDDILNGGSGADTIVGNDGDDTLISSGDDQLEGGEDSDRYIFISFSDKTIIDSGGEGDTLDFEQVPQGTDLIDGVSIDLSIDDGSVQQVRTGGRVSLLGKFENVIGSAFDDSIYAGDDSDATSNLLFGGSGDDTISAGGGNDILDGGDGNDSVFGGDGDDSITSGSGNDSLDGGSGNDSIFGGDGDDSITSGGDNDTLDGGDGNDSIFGGDGDDSINGGDGSDLLETGDGNDSIFGGDGDDSIIGGRGNDELIGGTGNDSIFGGEGDATIDGGAGNDVIVGGNSRDSIFGGAGDDSIVVGGDRIGNDARDSIFGGDGDDTITGDGKDIIDGGEGNDSIFGGAGDNTISGGRGNDVLVGGDGNDSIFGGEGDDSISGSGDGSVFGTGGGADSIFGGGGDDTITGGSQGRHRLDGGSGNDSIFGLGGDETIDGGDGDDTLIGGDGIDSIFGGMGDDSIIAGGGPTGPSNPDLDNDSIFGGDGDDTIVGDAGGRDMLSGGDGNDSIFGGGDETIDGGRGNDTIIGGLGSDSIFGGEGDDSIDVGRDDIDPSGQDSINPGNDSVFGGDGDDTIIGGIGGYDTLSGGEGDDSIFGADDETILGGGGNDTLVGNAGSDSIFGGDGDDWIDVSRDDVNAAGNDSIDLGNDSVFGGDGDDTILGGGNGYDTLLGGSGNDSIFGGDGDETIDGGSGNDTLIGGAGSDSIFGGSGDDSISAGNDSRQDLGNDSVFGGDGDDTISGNGSGTDTLSGGAGNDSIFGGDGDESIDGGIGNDTLIGNSGDDSIFGGDGDDSIDAGLDDAIGTGSDSILGGDGNDTISGDGDGDDVLDGGSGNDSIFGGHGDETIYGGPGDDTLGGGAGNDSIFGGIALDDDGSDYVISIADTDMRLTPDALFHSEGSSGAFTFLLKGIERAALIGGDSANLLDATEFPGGALLSGGSNDDTLLGGSGADSLEGGPGNDSLVGGSGADSYVLIGENLGQDEIVEAAENHGDQIDLFGFNVGYGVTIDLSLDGEQVLETDPSTGTTLTSVQWASNTLEGAIGTVYGDRIGGSDHSDRLVGAGGLDSLYGGSGDDLIIAGTQRYVLLDFDSATEQGEHFYTDEERALIEAQMSRDYALFDVIISRDQAYIESFGQPYITVRFNDAPIINGVPSPGGVSERIGWRLLERGGTVKVNVNGFFGDRSNQLPPDNSVTDDNIQANVAALSTTIASHELAHMYGLRHVDSLGAPGQGIFGGLSERGFLPSFRYLDNLGEAASHLLASPASIGSALIDAVGNPFFGEREAVKLAFAETGQTRLEKTLSTVTSAVFGTVHELGMLPALAVPNPVEIGINAGVNLLVSALNVAGEIVLDANKPGPYSPEGTSENDIYSFYSSAGKLTIELLSYTLRHRMEDRIDSLLRVYDSAGNKLEYFGSPLGAFNDDGFEGSDSVLIDINLPYSGIYYVEVDTFSFTNNPELEAYSPIPSQLIDQIIALNPDADSVKDTDTGEYELFLYRFDGSEGAFIPALGDTISGGAGADTLVGTSGNDTFFSDAYDSIVDRSGNPNVSVSVDEGSTASLTLPFHDLRDGSVLLSASIGTATDNGDGTWTWAYTPGDGPDEGQSVTVAIENGTRVTNVSFTLTVSNVSPTIALSGNSDVDEGAPFTLTLGPVTDPGDDTVSQYVVHWGDGTTDTYNAAENVTHRYADGNATATISVDLVDEDGTHLESGTFDVAIRNVAPTIVLSGAASDSRRIRVHVDAGTDQRSGQ